MMTEPAVTLVHPPTASLCLNVLNVSCVLYVYLHV